MGNVLRNSSPGQQTLNVAPGLLTNQNYLTGLGNENQYFTPSLVSNSQFTRSLAEKPEFVNTLDPKLRGNPQFVDWLNRQISSGTAGASAAATQATTAAQSAQSAFDQWRERSYDPHILEFNTLSQTVSGLPTSLPQNPAMQQFVDNRSSGILNTWQQSTYNQDKTQFNSEIDAVESGLAAVGTDFSNFKTNPVFGGQLQAPGSGLKISGQSQWELKEDSTGKLCLTIGGNGIACINSTGDLVPPTEKFAYPKIPSHVRMYRQKPQMKF